MKDTFDDEDRQALVEYRINRACETMKEALLLNNGGFYNGAVVSIYYACYHAAKALLLSNDIQVQENIIM